MATSIRANLFVDLQHPGVVRQLKLIAISHPKLEERLNAVLVHECVQDIGLEPGQAPV